MLWTPQAALHLKMRRPGAAGSAEAPGSTGAPEMRRQAVAPALAPRSAACACFELMRR